MRAAIRRDTILQHPSKIATFRFAFFGGADIAEPVLEEPRRDGRLIIAAVALYAFAVIVYFVLPSGAVFNRVLIGSAVYNHDAVLNAGILEWGYRSLWTPGLHFFDWPA